MKYFRLFRNRPSLARILRGGRLDDLGRLPRYSMIFILSAVGLWVPIVTYLKVTPDSFTSEVSLILPGSGAQASVNLADLGQASSSAASAFSSSRISPTQTYKRLLAANRTLERASRVLGIEREALGGPRIKLVDETSLIHFEMAGPDPLTAQARAEAILRVFLEELDALRQDEMVHREAAARVAIVDYEKDVKRLREEIAFIQTASGLVSFDHFQDIVAKRDELARALEAARNAKFATDASMHSLSDQIGLTPNEAASNLRLHADPEFQTLAQIFAEQSAALAEAQGRFGAQHPVVRSAWHAVSGTENKLAARGRTVVGNGLEAMKVSFDIAPDPARGALLSELIALAAECDAKASSVASLEQQLVDVDLRIAELAPKAARLDDLSRDYQVAEAVFASALARTDTSKAEVFASYPLVQVLADATLPSRPSSPRPKIAIAAGIAATLMVMMALCLAWLRRPLIARLLDRDPHDPA